MKRVQHQSKQRADDFGMPTLLLVAAAAVLAGVVAIVVAGSAGTVLAVVIALAIALGGLVAVAATITHQMDDADGVRVQSRRRSS